MFLAVHVCTEKIKGEAVFFAKSGKPFGNRTAVRNLQITAGRSLAGSINYKLISFLHILKKRRAYILQITILFARFTATYELMLVDVCQN